MIFACLAAANSDPAVFENPERLNLRRQPNRHIAFGDGIHYCLGAALARVEIEIALRQLLTRFPDLELSVPRSRIKFSRRPGTRARLPTGEARVALEAFVDFGLVSTLDPDPNRPASGV
jgi:cytochrome P450